MLAVGMAVVFAGYTVSSYGWVLLKGWNIPFRQWVSPLNPYTWPAGGAEPPPIPASQLFPGPASGSGGASGGSAAAAGTNLTPAQQRAKTAQQAGTNVAGRLGP
jgi:hypothetical protein